MKKLHLLKTMLLLCALIVGSSSVWADETPVVTADFTAKTVGHSLYTDTWTYGNWSLTRCANNNGDWGYIRCGGKGGASATATTTESSVIQGTSKISSAIKEVKLLHNGTNNSSATINYFKLEVASDKDFNNITNSITDETPISKSTAGTITFNTGAPYAANSYYRITINWTIKGSRNYGIDVTKIEFYEPSSTPSVSAADVNLAYDATGGTIESTISNPVVGGVLTAVKKTEADWLTLGDVSGSNVPFTTTTNDGPYDREATVTLTYTYNTSETATKDVVITQAHLAREYATLPFNWAGGASATLAALDGVTVNADKDDYAESNAPYLVKFNGTGKYVIVRTNSQPGIVTMGVKMIGGATTSTITVQESEDGETYTDVEILSISGSTDDIVNLTSTKAFKSESRYVKLYYTKGSNVGVGPITITGTETITLNAACTDEGKYYGTYSNSSAFVVPADLTVSTVKVDGNGKLVVTPYATGDIVKANTGVMVSATSAGDKTVALSSETGTEISGNMLKASSVAMTGDNLFYRLTMHEGTQIGFWWGAEDGAAFSIAANKAYLAVPEALATLARSFWFDEGETTAISEVRGLKSDVRGEYFNLNGQRVAQPTKGLYIVNGRKVVIK